MLRLLLGLLPLSSVPEGGGGGLGNGLDMRCFVPDDCSAIGEEDRTAATLLWIRCADKVTCIRTVFTCTRMISSLGSSGMASLGDRSASPTGRVRQHPHVMPIHPPSHPPQLTSESSVPPLGPNITARGDDRDWRGHCVWSWFNGLDSVDCFLGLEEISSDRRKVGGAAGSPRKIAPTSLQANQHSAQSLILATSTYC